MPLYRRSGTSNWWVRLGRATRRSTGTQDRAEAEEFEERLRQRIWRLKKLGDRSAISWQEVAKRWLTETTKRTKRRDKDILAWFAPYLDAEAVSAIDRDAIERLREHALADGKTKAHIDRMMCVLRAILRKCESDWRCLEHAPKVPMYRPPVPEPRWLTPEEFARLYQELPKHLALAARLAVLTMLRMRSMLALTWDRVDLRKRRAWIPGLHMKAGHAHGIPISRAAAKVLRQLRTLNPEGKYVFQWNGKPIDDCNTRAFQEAVKRSGVAPLRWHDLRHTGASWAVQSGVTLQELMQLGDWKSYSMVLRYAHLAPDHLAAAAEKVGQNVAQPKRRYVRS